MQSHVAQPSLACAGKLDRVSERDFVCRTLPPFRSKVEGEVQTLDWRKAGERETACRLLFQHSVNPAEGPTAPLLIKRAVADWPALQRWSLHDFQRQYAEHRVMVRCSPSMRFYYVEPLLLPFWRKWNSFTCQPQLAPSHLAPMSMGEFIRRMQQDCSLPPVMYKDEEFYYMQSSLTNGMLRDINLYAPPLSCLGAPGATGAPGERPMLMPSGMKIAQVPRIFVSPAGAVSPLHYDTASSFLTQIRGRKRLILYQPRDLPNLYPYGRLHILRRRSRLDPANPDFDRFPKFQGVVGIEALLEPGDVLWFPGYWSHYTESMDFSISMTYRFWTEEQKKTVKRGLLGLLLN